MWNSLRAWAFNSLNKWSVHLAMKKPLKNEIKMIFGPYFAAKLFDTGR